jgi:hypothetical protein
MVQSAKYNQRAIKGWDAPENAYIRTRLICLKALKEPIRKVNHPIYDATTYNS